jgi:hypothetical protein
MPATQPRIKRVLVSTLRRVLGQNIGMRAKLVLSGGFKNLLTYGIRKDGRLVCVAVLSEGDEISQRPPILSRIVLWLIGLISLPIFTKIPIKRGRNKGLPLGVVDSEWRLKLEGDCSDQ